MNITLIIMLMSVVFLFGVLVIAAILYYRFCDRSATYPLYAARDRIIGVVVHDNFPRDDEWLDWLYKSINMVLKGSNLIAGPSNDVQKIANILNAKRLITGQYMIDCEKNSETISFIINNIIIIPNRKASN